MNGNRLDPQLFMDAALELAHGEPELVVVDARALRLIMGPLGQLLILRPLSTGRAPLPPGEEPYVWDADDICD